MYEAGSNLQVYWQSFWYITTKHKMILTLFYKKNFTAEFLFLFWMTFKEFLYWKSVYFFGSYTFIVHIYEVINVEKLNLPNTQLKYTVTHNNYSSSHKKINLTIASDTATLHLPVSKFQLLYLTTQPLRHFKMQWKKKWQQISHGLPEHFLWIATSAEQFQK